MGLQIVAIANALPSTVLTNAQLEAELLQFQPDGGPDFQKVVEKTQILSRHVAPPDVTALDLALQAATSLRDHYPEDFAHVDYVIHCTQSPEYLLPTTACLLQTRLKMSENTGAIDVNLGCSGYVYCLSLADALLRAGHARKILLTTADTYTHYIHPRDVSNRVIFGDGAAATLLTMNDDVSPSRFVHWTDGGSADHLIVRNGASRQPGLIGASGGDDEFSPPDPRCLYMNGFEVFRFGITKVPALMTRFCEQHHADVSQFDWFVPHQANAYMLSELNKRIKFPADRVVQHFQLIGNTVSASIPLAIEAYLRRGKIQSGERLLLAGFGVGFSAAIGDVVIA